MFNKIINYSIQNKLVIGIFTVALIAWGIYSTTKIPIDAVPDITNNQVLVITQAPSLAVQEVEQFITFPIEISLSNLPDVEEIRSISRFGISVITVVFKEEVDLYLARQLISEQLKIAEQNIPKGFGTPELGPITSGLGEIYQYVLHTAPGYDTVYSVMDLRTINDWIVKRQLAGTPGIIEVSGWGGELKQYEVAINPNKIKSLGVTIGEVFQALENNNENTGGSYIEKQYNSYFIRGEGLMKSIADIEQTVVKTVNNIPILVRDIATVQIGAAPRYGAVTYNAQGEVVAGQTLMLKGENSYKVVKAVKEKIEIIKKSLPEGVLLDAYIDRSQMIERAISTVTTNLIEGGLIVVFILVLLLGNFRGGLIVASVIPLAMLFALCMMNIFGVSANLMSLGAIDFGLIVDGSVIIVESIIHRLYTKHNNKTLTTKEMNDNVYDSSVKIRSSAAFGEIIILIVYLPILALVGIEGKMFGPMAQTVSFAILGALILSLTYVPMMCALVLKKEIKQSFGVADKIIQFFQKGYAPLLSFSLKKKGILVALVMVIFGMSLVTFSRLGGEFMPTLEEGDFALHQILPPGTSLSQSVDVSKKIQKVLLDKFPEIEMIVTKIGTAEIPTDPMPIEVGDIMVKMKPKSEWQYPTKDEMFEAMERELSVIAGVGNEFTQPIQMRFNELISGVREDIAVKIYGADLNQLALLSKKASSIINPIEGVGDMKIEQTVGLPQIVITYNREKMAKYGMNIKALNTIVRAAFAGEKAGVVFENERRFDLVIRLGEKHRKNIQDIENLYVSADNGNQIPLSEVASIEFKSAPMQISRENTRRRITIGINARNRDVESLVNEIDEQLATKLKLPPGYFIEYGGQFENLIAAKERLSVAVPIALGLILLLLFFTFGSFSQALLIFTAIPLSAIGGIYALWLRDMPFSISAGIGFIALFGVAVLNGIVLIGYFNQLKKEGINDVDERIRIGTNVRLRPVLMTALVAALGFLPMALSNSAGGEVQKPLATVVIGGLITATLLTLIILPILYSYLEKMQLKTSKKGLVVLLMLFAGSSFTVSAQDSLVNLNQLIGLAINNHPTIKIGDLEVERQKALQKTAFNLRPTNVSYSKGKLNNATSDYQWNISQSFDFPTSYLAKVKRNKSKVVLAEKQREISKNDLIYEVKMGYVQLDAAQKKLSLLKELQQHYQNFKQISVKRMEAGEINMMAVNIARSKIATMVLAVQQADLDVQIIQNYLQQLVGSKNVIEIQPLAELDMELTEATVKNNPALGYYQQQLTVNEQQISVQKSNYLPNFSIGYINQQIEGIEGMQAFKVQVGIPLFYGKNRGNLQATKINNEQLNAELAKVELELSILLNKKLQLLQKANTTINYYINDGLPIANQLLNFTEKGFQQGEISYLELLEGIKEVNKTQQDYQKSKLNKNTLIIEIQHIIGVL